MVVLSFHDCLQDGFGLLGVRVLFAEGCFEDGEGSVDGGLGLFEFPQLDLDDAEVGEGGGDLVVVGSVDRLVSLWGCTSRRRG